MDWIFSLVTLAALALVLGAVALWRRGGARRQAWLMLLLAAVMIANVLIWAVPLPDGAG
jgi:predicted alpha/beta hydrolase